MKTTKQTMFHKCNLYLLFPLTILGSAWIVIGILLGLIGVQTKYFLPLTQIVSLHGNIFAYVSFLFYLVIQTLLICLSFKDGRKYYTSFIKKITFHYILNILWIILCFIYVYVHNVHHAVSLNLHVLFDVDLSPKVIFILLFMVSVALIVYDVQCVIYYLKRTSLFVNRAPREAENSLSDFEEKAQLSTDPSEAQDLTQRETATETSAEEETPVRRTFYKIAKGQSVQDTLSMTTICPNCHTLIKRSDALYCPECGTKLQK